MVEKIERSVRNYVDHLRKKWSGKRKQLRVAAYVGIAIWIIVIARFIFVGADQTISMF